MVDAVLFFPVSMCSGASREARLGLVLAGGYDDRLPENVEHASELEDLRGFW